MRKAQARHCRRATGDDGAAAGRDPRKLSDNGALWHNFSARFISKFLKFAENT